jgi:hypothetical protein
MRMILSDRDWELLSAYMDGQLSNGKRTQLEARMKSNPELRAALEDLTQTRTMLRSLPRLKAPRSFKLTSEMVGQKQPKRLYPFFQFASALTSLMLVLVLLSDWLGFGLQAPFGQSASQAPDAPVAAEVVVESAPESLALEMPAEEQMDALKAVPAEEGQLEESMEEQARMAVATAEAEPTGAADAYLAAPAAPEEAAPNLSMEAAEVPPDASVTGDTPAEMPAAEPQAAESETDQASPVIDRAPPEGFSGMRILEISLALVAFGTALMAFYLRRTGG